MSTHGFRVLMSLRRCTVNNGTCFLLFWVLSVGVLNQGWSLVGEKQSHGPLSPADWCLWTCKIQPTKTHVSLFEPIVLPRFSWQTLLRMYRNARHQYKWNEVKNSSYDRTKNKYIALWRLQKEGSVEKEGSTPWKKKAVHHKKEIK
jgi:hypothetical protein